MKKLKTRIILLLFLPLIPLLSHGQVNSYKFKKELEGITETWHKVTLPNQIFKNVSKDLSDIRIIGFSSDGDTIEIPFILDNSNSKIIKNEVEFNLINRSNNGSNFYFTFELPKKETINKIILEFSNKNFDWRVGLAGSQNQNEWFDIINDYRIISINNEHTNYSFTTLNFPKSKYQYFRLEIESSSQPKLTEVRLNDLQLNEGIYQEIKIENVTIDIDKKNKQTKIDIKLPEIVPVSFIKVNINDTFDYYRPYMIKYLSDSTNTPKGTKYLYRNIISGTLSSLEKNEITFPAVITGRLRLIINNGNNQPLNVSSIDAKGSIYTLTARFTDQAADYYLFYGNKKAKKPNYDISLFKKNIPASLKELSMGEEKIIEQIDNTSEPLFKDKIWLWLIMTVIIIVLGGFTFKMIKNNN